MIAEVIINNSAKELDRTFDYNVPEEMEKEIKIGSRILVPFGNIKRLEEGFVVGFKDTTEYKIKNIAKILKESSLSKTKVELAKWMSKRYFCNLSDCIKLMLPPGTTSKKIENRIKEKTGKFVCLKVDEKEVIMQIQEGKIKSEKHIRLLNFLINNGETFMQDLETITEVSKSIMKTLEKNGYIQIYEKQIERNPIISKNIQKSSSLKFTEEQQNAFNKIEVAIDDKINAEYLIFGVTGSR